MVRVFYFCSPSLKVIRKEEHLAERHSEACLPVGREARLRNPIDRRKNNSQNAPHLGIPIHIMGFLLSSKL